MLDETWHLHWDQKAWAGERTSASQRLIITGECTRALANSVQSGVSRVQARFFDDCESAELPEPIRLRTVFASRFGDARDETPGEERVQTRESLRACFNGPFRPFVLVTTSIGQEGLDFHPWCHRVVHWNLPGNPVDLEQREGRVNRYKGHAVRRNVARTHGSAAIVRWRPGDDLWAHIFELAESAARAYGANDLIPCWMAPGPFRIERRVALLPYSRDQEAYQRLKRQLAVYRVVFGQPRQEELLSLLTSSDVAIEQLQRWAIDLTPRAF